MASKENHVNCSERAQQIELDLRRQNDGQSFGSKPCIRTSSSSTAFLVCILLSLPDEYNLCFSNVFCTASKFTKARIMFINILENIFN